MVIEGSDCPWQFVVVIVVVVGSSDSKWELMVATANCSDRQQW